MMSLSKRASGNLADPGPELECEELDWDSYTATLENRLGAVGNFYWFVELPFFDLLFSQTSKYRTLF